MYLIEESRNFLDLIDDDLLPGVGGGSLDLLADEFDHRTRLKANHVIVVLTFELAVTDDEGYIHILAQSDGRLLGRRKLDGKGVRSRMVYADGVLYAFGNSGSLQALEVTVR